MDTIRWSAFEHQPLPKSADWFWALGIIAVGAAATSIILGNILFGVLILAASIAIGVMATQEPDEITFELGARHLTVGETRYKLEELQAFWISDENGEPLLLIDTPRIMAPDLVIPLDGADPHAVRDWFLARDVPEKELHESVSLKILEMFGF